jgi:hypothetical protein
MVERVVVLRTDAGIWLCGQGKVFDEVQKVKMRKVQWRCGSIESLWSAVNKKSVRAWGVDSACIPFIPLNMHVIGGQVRALHSFGKDQLVNGQLKTNPTQLLDFTSSFVLITYLL